MLNPYIHFQGNCREAMTAYNEILGGSLEVMTYGDVPNGPPNFTDSKQIIHSHLTLPDQGNLMASDYPPGQESHPQKSVTVSITFGTIEESRKIFDKLSEGGEVGMPFGPSFFSSGFGMVRDRFGTHWMVVTQP